MANDQKVVSLLGCYISVSFPSSFFADAMAPKSRSYQISATPVTVLGHLLFITVTVLMFVWLLKFREGLAFQSSDKNKIFNLHPFLMVIGFILFGGEAIMAYKSIPGGRDIRVQKTIHVIFQTIALGCGILGIVAVFKFHNETDGRHMYTLHSWLGMIAICLFGLQWLLGFFSFVFPGAESYSRSAYRPWHVFGGLVIFFLAIATAEMGLLQKFLSLVLFRGQQALIINFIGLLLFLFAVAVGLTVLLPHNY